MTTAYLEGLRTTRYRRRLAALLRRPACRSISFAIGTAPIHRNFFSETASAIEGLPTGGTRKWNGVTHRQVQYGVRLRIDAEVLLRTTRQRVEEIRAVAGDSEKCSTSSSTPRCSRWPTPSW